MPIDPIRDRVQNPRPEGFGNARNTHEHALAQADRERCTPPGSYEEHHQRLHKHQPAQDHGRKSVWLIQRRATDLSDEGFERIQGLTPLRSLSIRILISGFHAKL